MNWEQDLARREAESAGWDNLRASILCTRRRTRWAKQSPQSFYEATALFAAGCITGSLIILVMILAGVI